MKFLLVRTIIYDVYDDDVCISRATFGIVCDLISRYRFCGLYMHAIVIDAEMMSKLEYLDTLSSIVSITWPLRRS